MLDQENITIYVYTYDSNDHTSLDSSSSYRLDKLYTLSNSADKNCHLHMELYQRKKNFTRHAIEVSTVSTEMALMYEQHCANALFLFDIF
jgi:hypothetical protein